jgi:quercetin dioxygenase-like cupin family protein
MTRFISLLCTGLVATVGSSNLRAQSNAQDAHQHTEGAACVPVTPGQPRPPSGCFIVGSSSGLQFSEPVVYWHLRTFRTRAAAEAAKSRTGVIVEEDGKVWLSEFGPKGLDVRGGDAVAVVGPLDLLPASTYEAEIAYAVMPPGDRSRVHTHFGPEAWYMIAGEQCLETPSGTTRARPGESMAVTHSVPMELTVTGTRQRRSLVLVIHDSTKTFAAPSNWTPTGACRR